MCFQLRTLVLAIIVSFNCSLIFAQEETKVYQTFKDTRVINSQSVETLKKGHLDFRIGHRFGNINTGWEGFYGFENATDVVFQFDYGLNDNIMVGIVRAKGSGDLRQNVTGLLKWKILNQGSNSPFSVAFSGLTTVSTMARDTIPGRINHFAKFLHRVSYNLQVIIASKLSERISVQVAPQWTYRNIVPSDDARIIQDQNDLPSLSGSFKYQFSKTFALIFDATLPFSEFRSSENPAGEREFYAPVGVGFEWETGGGHVFQLNLTNATGIIETDYIPYTRSNWRDGEFRIGFTISRQFRLK